MVHNVWVTICLESRDLYHVTFTTPHSNTPSSCSNTSRIYTRQGQCSLTAILLASIVGLSFSRLLGCRFSLLLSCRFTYFALIKFVCTFWRITWTIKIVIVTMKVFTSTNSWLVIFAWKCKIENWLFKIRTK